MSEKLTAREINILKAICAFFPRLGKHEREWVLNRLTADHALALERESQEVMKSTIPPQERGEP